MKAPTATATSRPHTAPPCGARSHIIDTDAIRAHNRHQEAHTRRRLAHEDCCAYCDLHCSERLSKHQHHVIQAWTSDVNANMCYKNARFDYITKQSGDVKERQKTKLIYERYSPPGNPDLEDGFRRVPTPMSMRSRKSSASSSGRRSTKYDDVTRKKWQMTPKHTWEVPVDDEMASRMNLIAIGSREQNRSEKAFEGSTKSQSEYAGSEKHGTLLRRPSTGTIHIKGDETMRATSESDSARNRSEDLRSCSNKLLNVYTIDDGLRHFGHKLSRPSSAATDFQQDASPRSETKERVPSATNKSTRSTSASLKNPQTMSSIKEESYTNLKSASDIKSDKSDKHRQSYDRISSASAEGGNEAVHKAFKNLENSKEVTNKSKLFEKLYKLELKTKTKSSADTPKESATFRRMNKNLKNKIMDQYRYGSEMSWKLHNRYGVSRPSTAKSASRSSAKSSSQDTRASRQNAQLSRGQGHVYNGDSQSQSLTMSRDDNNTDPEHFLEMLMNLEHETLDRATGNINLHTFLYV